MQITEILRAKDGDVVTIEPDATVRELIDLLAEHNIGAVVVSRDGATLAGIVSERDIVRRLQTDPGLAETTVAGIMTADVHTTEPTTTVDALMRLMTEHRVRHVPVVVGNQLSGLVSIGDVVKSRINELEFEREQLEHYIATSR